MTLSRKFVVGLVAGMLVAGSVSAESLPRVEKSNGTYPTVDGVGAIMGEAPAIDPEEFAVFEIRKGEKLREAMSRWTQSTGYEMVWQPEPEDGDVRFAADMQFSGTFAEASKDFFAVVRTQTKFDGRLHSNRVLRVFVANAKQ
jgi:hypothetical protein